MLAPLLRARVSYNFLLRAARRSGKLLARKASYINARCDDLHGVSTRHRRGSIIGVALRYNA